MSITLDRVECVATRGELREEPCLYWRLDGDDDWVGSRSLGRRGMRQGETVDLDIEVEPNRLLEVRLTEYDGANHRYDDCLGRINFVVENVEYPEHLDGWRIRMESQRIRDLQRGGWFFLDLPAGADDNSDQHYRLYYHVSPAEGTRSRPWVHLLLQEIRCANAQQWKDCVYLKVNGVKVGEAVRMRDRGDDAIKTVGWDGFVPPDTVISLWEEDPAGRDDHFGTYELHVTDTYDYSRIPDPIRFHYEKYGSATYYLTYEVRPPISPDGR